MAVPAVRKMQYSFVVEIRVDVGDRFEVVEKRPERPVFVKRADELVVEDQPVFLQPAGCGEGESCG